MTLKKKVDKYSFISSSSLNEIIKIQNINSNLEETNIY